MKEFFELAAVSVEVAAVLLLLVGLTFSTARFLLRAVRGSGLTAYHAFRQELGRNLLLTLEILIGADIIWTVAVEQTFMSLGMLGLRLSRRVMANATIASNSAPRYRFPRYSLSPT